MKIAILTSGILPVPAVEGGAVENLVDSYLDYNDRVLHHDITVYSIAPHDAQSDVSLSQSVALSSACNHYRFIPTHTLTARLRKLMQRVFCRKRYYHPAIEYYLGEALRHIARSHYDLIVLENRPGYALRLSEVSDARIAIHLHNDTLNYDSPLSRDIYERAWRILTVSDYIARRVGTIVHRDRKSVVVHNGIDLDLFSAASATDVDRASLGFSPDDFVLVYSGRLTREKGIRELIEAMQLLPDPRIKLLVIGGSFFGNATSDDPFTANLKRLALPMADRIVFTGFQPYRRMSSYLRLADVAVIPSVWDDPFPTTVLEAMAAGLPVLATHSGGIPEEVDEECARLIFRSGDTLARDIATEVERLRLSPALRKRMAEASLRRSRQFSREAYSAAFFHALEEPA